MKIYVFMTIAVWTALVLLPQKTIGTADRIEEASTVFCKIDRAYKNGEIDYETALVQKVYAIFQPQRLKSQYQVEGLKPERCATPIFLEIRNNWSSLSPATRTTLGPYLLRPTEPGTQEPYGHAYTTDAEYFDTPSGHCRIWYVRTTDDAPDSTDVDPEDGVPDWINRCGMIFDHVWAREIDELGYRQPPQDGDWYPEGEDYGGDSKYDVYIENLGQWIFGYTQSEYLISETRSATSYIVVDDDYEWYPNYNPGKEPIDALKVTVAHEFFHAIHFGYDAVEISDRWWMEISSVWMEDIIYDDVNDYFAYLPWFFNEPGSSLDWLNGMHEFGSGIWAMFLDQKYDTDIIRTIWEGCASTSALSAMQAALSARGSSLAEALKTFAVWNYFTGNRANQDLYYEEGADYPSVRFEDRHLSYPASDTGQVDHLGANYIGFLPQNTSGGLHISFNGVVGPTWSALILEYQSPGEHIINELSIDNQGRGFFSALDWLKNTEIVLIPCVVSISGRDYTFSYDAEYDPNLMARVIVRVDTTSTIPGDITHVSIDMDNGTWLAAPIGSFEMELRFDDNFLVLIEVVSTERTQSMSTFEWNMLGLGTVTLSISDTSGNAIESGTGPVAEMSFVTSDAATYGDTAMISILETILIDDRGDTVVVEPMGGLIYFGLMGDVNSDRSINVLDVVAVIRHILGIEILAQDAHWLADCNNDGEINALDVFGLVNLILGLGECVPGAYKTELTPEVMAFLESLKMYLSAEEFARFMALIRVEVGVPAAYSLAQNYPNPFNPTTTISYTLPSGDRRRETGDRTLPLRITLKIYNILGQEVRTLVDEQKEPGYYTISWDGRDAFGNHVASGIYFYRLTSGQFTAAKRMILLK